MNSETYLSILLAQGSRLDSLASGVRRKSNSFDGTDVLIGFAILAGVILAGSLLYMIMNRGERNTRCNSPKKLFRTLCRTHQLDRASRRILRQMASHQRLGQPARLFLEPERFEAVNLSPALRSQNEKVGELQAKLFRAAEAA